MKKFLALLLAVIMVLTMAVSAIAEEELLQITIFDEAANYHGIQTGWFAQVVKERFNIELNIIAPQVAGNSVFATRAAEGYLGDILIMDKASFADAIAAGLVKDISDALPGMEHLQPFMVQINSYNKDFGEGVYYGIPAEMTDTSPVTLTAELVGSQPQLRWDLYQAVGAPEIADIDAFLDVLAQIHAIHPANEAGDPAYPFTLWPDWDNNDNMSGPANVVQLTTWYGQKLKNSAMLMPDNTFAKITDREVAYYKIVKMLNKAFQMGLVDPESFEQGWNEVCAKISNGQADVIWYNWEIGFWNSQERLNNGTAFQFIPVGDQVYYCDADPFYGSARVWGVGNGIDEETYERVIAFLDWYASPEALVFQHCGIEGLTYTVNAEGKYDVYMDNALMDNLPVPAPYEGNYQDGFNAVNQWLCASICTNPITGETYDMKFWASYIAKNMTQMKSEWMARFDAQNAVDWMKKNGKLLASPSVSFSPASDDNDHALIRSEINTSLCKYTWQMIAAPDDATFEALWDEMVAELEGLGYDDLFEYDCEKWQPEVDMKIEAAAAAAQ
ncbi:MAG: sugar ABC transporter substrate-binding protein [Clostridiales bacterium]|nr:sugar ABC transporter substrate-binding protein [Clostridiales bacterium]